MVVDELGHRMQSWPFWVLYVPVHTRQHQRCSSVHHIATGASYCTPTANNPTKKVDANSNTNAHLVQTTYLWCSCCSSCCQYPQTQSSLQGRTPGSGGNAKMGSIGHAMHRGDMGRQTE